jgi:hypothetical protein
MKRSIAFQIISASQRKAAGFHMAPRLSHEQMHDVTFQIAIVSRA